MEAYLLLMLIIWGGSIYVFYLIIKSAVAEGIRTALPAYASKKEYVYSNSKSSFSSTSTFDAYDNLSQKTDQETSKNEQNSSNSSSGVNFESWRKD